MFDWVLTKPLERSPYFFTVSDSSNYLRSNHKIFIKVYQHEGKTSERSTSEAFVISFPQKIVSKNFWKVFVHFK